MKRDLNITGTIRIGDYDISKDDIWLYINHFCRDKTDLWDWEQKRQEFHNNIFNNLGFDRFSKEGIKLSPLIDKFCEPHILKYDRVESKLKGLNSAKNDAELKIKEIELRNELIRKSYLNSIGARELRVDDETDYCRICDKYLDDGIPRINDFLISNSSEFDINKPICLDCSNNNPDEFNKEFKRKFWRNK